MEGGVTAVSQLVLDAVCHTDVHKSDIKKYTWCIKLHSLSILKHTEENADMGKCPQ